MAQFSDNKFCLHDTEVSAIECLNNKINLIFNDGIYVLNDKGKEAEKTLKCAMSLEIREFNPDTAWEHITVYKFKGKKFKEISFNNFCELVKENGFKVYLDYYCSFAQSVLLKGDIGKFGIEISLTEIDKIAFNF